MDELKWYSVIVVSVLGFVFGGIFYSEHLQHLEKMECIKARGEFIGKVCVFRDK